MKTSLHIRIRNKVSGLLVILMPFFFCATALASPFSHKADYGSFYLTDTTVNTTSTVILINKQNVIIPDSYSNAFISSSQYTLNNVLNRNSKPKLSTVNALAAPPTIICPDNIVTNTDPGFCRASKSGLDAITSDPDGDITTLTWTMSGATLAASPISGINNVPSPFNFNKGNTIVTYRVSDAGGSTVSCSFTVTVNDKEVPSIVCPSDANITIPSCATITDTISFSLLSVSDNCGILNFSSNAPLQFPLGNTSVIWKANDINGNSNQCTQNVSVTNVPVMTLVGSSTLVSCFGGNDGTAKVTVSGGSLPFAYSWNTVPVQTTQTATNLAPGTYTVTVTDFYNCTATTSVTVSQPATPVTIAVTVKDDVKCFGASTGSVTVAGNGGTPGYQYSIDGIIFQVGAIFSNLAAGTYTLTIRDSKNCVNTTSVIITQPAIGVSGVITSQTDVACQGTATGSVTVSGNGGTPPYQYNINGGAFQATGTFSNLSAGTYTVTVKDASNCESGVAVTITQPVTALTASITNQTNVLCSGQANGSATVTASGGTSPYTYSWNTVPVQTAATAINLAAQNYTVTVTDAAGCQVQVNVTVTQPTPLVVTTTSTNVACFGDSTGTATALASGGTPPYTYAWLTTPIQTTATVANLPAGTYTVAVFDSSGCFKPAFVTITQPATKLISSITNIVNVACAGSNTGSVTVNGSGGVAPIQYNINGGTFQASGTFNSLAAGSYTIITRDANNCTVTLSAIITEPALPLTATISSQTNVLCSGQANGIAIVTASGGTAPYTYSWNTVPVQTAATAINLKAGNYTVTVTDSEGCIKTANVTITEPAPLNVTISKEDIACFGDSTGTATALASGGTPPYTYAWLTTPIQTTATISSLPAGTYTVAVFDSSGCFKPAFVTINQPASKFIASITNLVNVACAGSNTGSITVTGSGGTAPIQYNINGGTFQAGDTFNNLIAGAYTIIAKDANDCQVIIPATITEPASPLTALITSQTNILPCAGQTTGSATVTASGGTLPYTYSWNTIPEQTTAAATSLIAGTFTVTVTDAAGCVQTADVSITEPAPILVTITSEDIACKGDLTGSATVSASGGIPSYNYTWITTPVQTTATISNLSAGTYTVEVYDSVGCFKSGVVTISEPAAILTASITNQENVLCASSNTGSITVAGSGGTSPYQYNINGGAFQAGGTFGNLIAGTYTIIVKDTNNCEVIVAAAITSPPDGITASITSQNNVLCSGETNGSATVTTSGGTAPYTYSWNTTPVQTSASITNLAAGTYIVTSTDNAGCFVLDTAIIIEPLKLTASITNQVNFDCVTATNGSVTVEGADGTPGYQYSFNGGAYQAGGTYINLAPGNYIVTVQDANNCKVDVPVEIEISGLILAVDDLVTTPEDTPANANVMTNDQVICNLPIVVSANTIPQHGTVVVNPNGTFTYTPSLNYNGTDSFTYTITDNVGGTSTATVSIQVDAVNDPPVAVVDYDTTNHNTAVTIIVLSNDSDTENGILAVSVCDHPLNGLLITNSDGSITYTPNSDFSGNDEFCYTICDNGSPSRCDSALVYIYVIPKPKVEDVFVYNGFSPNGDGNNDNLVIRGIEDFPDNEIEFFNRNGSKIIKLTHYDNHNVFWDGTNKNGEQLPDGTYFYVLKIGDATPLTGWVFIRGKK